MPAWSRPCFPDTNSAAPVADRLGRDADALRRPSGAALVARHVDAESALAAVSARHAGLPAAVGELPLDAGPDVLNGADAEAAEAADAAKAARFRAALGRRLALARLEVTEGAAGAAERTVLPETDVRPLVAADSGTEDAERPLGTTC